MKSNAPINWFYRLTVKCYYSNLIYNFAGILLYVQMQ